MEEIEEIEMMAEDVVSTANSMRGIALSARVSGNELLIEDGDRTVASFLARGDRKRVRRHLEKFVSGYLATVEIRAAEPEAPVPEKAVTDTDFQSGMWDALDTVEPVAVAPVSVDPVAVAPVSVAPVSVAHNANKANKANKAKSNKAKSNKDHNVNKDTNQPWEENLRRAFEKATEIPRKILGRVASEEGLPPISLRLEVDSAGVYMLAGGEAISALSRDLTSYQLVRRLADDAWAFARAAEQRSNFRRKAREEAEAIRSASDVGVDAAAAAAIRSAVTQAVTQANAGLSGFGDVCRQIYGTPSSGSLETSGFSGGVVVSINGAVAFSVAFPKVSATRPLKAVVEFAKGHIGAVAKHHVDYLREAALRIERMSELRGIAAAQDVINEQKRKFA